MTERVDNMRLGGRPISLPVMGIFEIEKCRIKAWRDYFDLATFQRQLPDDSWASPKLKQKSTTVSA